MTTEQKAQAYDEAIEGIQEILSSGEDSIKMSRLQIRLQGIFPELKENKGEWIEKIRQELKSYLEHREVKRISESDAILQWIAWIEKQGEQKPTEWSEEDEKMFMSLHNLIYVVRDCDCDSMKKRELSDWFESLKDRVQLQPQQGESKPYSGVSFEYNGHTLGMCARDNGVEILIDSELKAFISLEKSFIYPVTLAPKSALKAAKEEKPDEKFEPKFITGDI